MAKLCVNVDHVATVRQARRIEEPDPVTAAVLAELAGAAGITCHVREDRRHVNEHDLRRLKGVVRTRLNLEIAVTDPMLALAEEVKPDLVMFVPENRAEVTTEGGLDVAGQFDRVRDATKRMKDAGLRVSHFIDPESSQIEAARRAGADVVELHTGSYANAKTDDDRALELEKIVRAAEFGANRRQAVNAGHGLNLRNVLPVAAIDTIRELHIGHSIVAQAVMVGFSQAVREMVDAIARGESLGRDRSPEEILRMFS